MIDCNSPMIIYRKDINMCFIDFSQLESKLLDSTGDFINSEPQTMRTGKNDVRVGFQGY